MTTLFILLWAHYCYENAFLCSFIWKIVIFQKYCWTYIVVAIFVRQKKEKNIKAGCLGFFSRDFVFRYCVLCNLTICNILPNNSSLIGSILSSCKHIMQQLMLHVPFSCLPFNSDVNYSRKNESVLNKLNKTQEYQKAD